MKLNKPFLIIFCLGNLVFMNACKDDCIPCEDPTNPDCSNYDPCYGKHRVTADFFIYENHPDLNPDRGWEYYDTDTLLGQSVLLVAKETKDKYGQDVNYTWLIGGETISGVKSVTRYAFPANVKIPVTLIVSKEPHLDCYPDDDGKDTLTRYMVFPSMSKITPKWQGEYIGYNTDKPNEQLHISLYTRDTTTGSTSRFPRLSGLPNAGCQWQLLDLSTFGYEQLQIKANGNFDCQSIEGLFRVFDNDSIYTKYTQMKLPNGNYNDREEKVFIGKRIR
jgi:hypothetical protein